MTSPRIGVSKISAVTLDDYEARAAAFWEGTRDHDVTENVDALLGAIEGAPPFRVLDFGCGPGRDLFRFRALGHTPTGLDGCEAFVTMARAHAGCEVLRQDFLALELPPASFDGVFANASLFHVPSVERPQVLAALRRALVPRGVLFASNPRGNDEEGWSGTRYGCFHDHAAWLRIFHEAGFEEVRHYYRPAGKPRDEQRWIAMVMRRSEAATEE